MSCRTPTLINTDTTTILLRSSPKKKNILRIAAADYDGHQLGVAQSDLKEFADAQLAVKVNLSISALGAIGPIVVLVSCSERELTKQMVVVEIPHLSINGTVDIRSDAPGHIVFYKTASPGEPSTLVQVHEWYDEYITGPFVELLLKKICGWDGKTEVRSLDAPRLSFDGANENLKAGLSVEALIRAEKLSMIKIKSSNSNTALEQPCDRGAGFKNLKRGVDHDVTATPISSLLRSSVESVFKLNESVLNLTYKNKELLVNFLGRLPTIMAGAYNPSEVMKSFSAVGSIDAVHGRYPVIETVLTSVRRKVTSSELEHVYDVWPELCKDFDEHGLITEECFNRVGIAVDTNLKGEPVPRCDDGPENEQRAKVLTAVAVRIKRDEARNQQVAAALEKSATGLEKARSILEQSTACEAVLRAAAAPFTDIANMDEKIFERPTASALKAFIGARRSQGQLPMPTKKGNAGAAENCLVALAFSMRTFPVVLSADAPPAAAPVPAVPIMLVRAPWGSPSAGLTSTQLLHQAPWVAAVMNAFSVSDTPRASLPADAESAELLCTMASSRIRQLLDDRLAETPTKKDSYVWKFVNDNMASCAAAATLLGLAADFRELKFLKCEDSLFNTDDSTFVKVEIGPLSLREGSYLVKTNKKPKVIRVGKVVGGSSQQSLRNFCVRWHEHQKGARLLDPKSRESAFYRMYPSESALNAPGPPVQRGYCENLVCCSGLGFSRANCTAVSALCATDGTGIFCWSTNTLGHLAATSCFRGCSTMHEKQLHMVGYLTEFFLGLMTSPRDNVSRNPGFESCLGPPYA